MLDSRSGWTLASSPGQSGYELLTRSGEVARRLIEVGDTFESMGALIVRHAACRVDDECGDGAAHTAVLTDALLREMCRLLSTGRDPHALVADMNVATAAVAARLEGFVRPCEGEALDQLVRRVIANRDTANLVIEAVQITGADGWVEIVETTGQPRLDLIEGARWPIAHQGSGAGSLVDWGDSAVLVVEEPVSGPAELAPLLDMLRSAAVQRLALVCRSFSEDVQGFLTSNSGRHGMPQVVPVRIPVEDDFDDVLQDVAAYVGSAVVSSVVGKSLGSVRAGDLGRSRRVQTSDRTIRLMASGSPQAAFDRAEVLRRRAADRPQASAELRRRAARLDGVVAEVGVSRGRGADDVVETAKNAAILAATAIKHGVVQSAAGSLLLAAQLACASLDIDPAVRDAFTRATAEPARHLLERDGRCADVELDRLRSVCDQLEPAAVELGDTQSARAVHATLTTAVSAAGAALCTSALVRNSGTQRRMEP
jgi:chaperonin GroEL